MTLDPSKPNRDMKLAHPLLANRWIALQAELAVADLPILLWECFRYDARQAWLYGQGRKAPVLKKVGVDPSYARAGPIVTNAWSAALSAHGWRLNNGAPASCAIDIVPLGPDGRPWTQDDPWDQLVEVVAKLSAKVGLRHFSKPGKPPWDKPHLQLVEWSDSLHRLVLPV